MIHRLPNIPVKKDDRSKITTTPNMSFGLLCIYEGQHQGEVLKDKLVMGMNGIVPGWAIGKRAHLMSIGSIKLLYPARLSSIACPRPA